MFRKVASAVVWRILSIPIFFKILGIGFLVAMLFGGVTVLQIRASASDILFHLLEQRSVSTAQLLTKTLEAHVSAGDLAGIELRLHEAKEAFPDIRYLVVRDRTGHAVASTIANDAPPDVQRDIPPTHARECDTRTFGSSATFMVAVQCPIGIDLGTIEIGVHDQLITDQLADLRGAVLEALLLCVALGAGLALLLTLLLTHPIHRLVESANRIREGEFETRADVFSNDEIGRLAIAFNEMAAGLTRFRREVQIKERARLSLIERIVQAQEDERKSLARELHDQFGQSLMALLLQVQSASKHNGQGGNGIPDSTAQPIERTIRHMIEEVHRLAWGMRPSILDDYGLDSALARHVEEVSAHGLDIDYQFTSPPGLERLPSRIEVPLFRIAQEAITNVQRHAQASHASVIILRRADEITLLIEDDGRGFDPAVLQEKGYECLGLMGMKERVALLGGSFLIESVPGEGTTIRVRIPLSEDRDAYPDLDRR